MQKKLLRVLVPGLFGATALALSMSAAAQTPPPAPPSPPPAAEAKTPPAAPMPGHHKGDASKAKHHADMKADCEAMMAKKHEMHEKLQAMDATLDKLVAEMNAAAGSKEVDAVAKPMAAVINELVAQRKTTRSMMMEMQHEMMGHMAHHMHMGGAKSEMECPMMKKGHAPEPKPDDKKPTM